MLNRRSVLAAGLGLPMALQAQGSGNDWPNRPVKVIVGFPPGQSSDGLARYFAAELQKNLGQTFVVDNRPGAGATLAAGAVAKSPADGYTVLMTSSGPMAVAPHLYANLGFDAMADLEPVAVAGFSPLVLVVRPDHPAKTLGDLVEMNRKKQLNAGSGGNGVTNHLALELLKLASAANFLHVPYKGSAPALSDLMGGQIDFMFESTGAALTQVKSGRLRAVAVSSPQRYAELPDTPTVAETFPGFDAMTWAMWVVPKGTPEAIKNRFAAEIGKVLKQPGAVPKLKQTGVEPPHLGETPAKAKAYALAEFEKWGKVIQQANIRLE